MRQLKNKSHPIFWLKNKYYYSKDLISLYNNWRIIIQKKKINPSSLIAFHDDYNLSSIAFFFAAIKENLIVVNLPIKQHNLIKTVPCKYFANIKDFKILRIKCSMKNNINDILPRYQRKKKSGIIIFSSGSSGQPKAILHDFNLLVNKFKKKRQGYKTLLMLTFDHIGGINTLLSSLINVDGLAISTDNKRDTKTICKIIEKTKAELLPTTPTFLNMLLFSEQYKLNDLSSLKLITFGTEPMPNYILKKLRKIFPKIHLKQTYGLSEIGIMRTKDKKNGSLFVKVGGEDYKTKVINNHLYIKSKTNMVGYLNFEQPFDKNGWLNTGDRVIKEKDGYIKILGRDSDLINIGGEKFYPQEIENVLLKHKNVIDTKVYSKTHKLLGNYVIADIILNKQIKKINIDSYKISLRNYCKKKLPKFKIPSRFIIKEYDQIINNRFKKITNNQK